MKAARSTRAVHEMEQGPFRIHVVASMTGVPEPTLRAWERRYGIPTPTRTASGYRLYAASDVAQVREMRLLCSGELSASDAAAQILSRGARQSAPLPADAFEAAQAAFMRAIQTFDDAAFDARLREVMMLGAATTILDRVIVPVLVDVGNRWRCGELGVAQEHFASQKLGTLLRDLLRLTSSARERTVLVAGFADDEHELGTLGAALRFASWDLHPIVLGARTPPSALRPAVAALKPAFIALSVTIPPERARARALVDEYAKACRHTPWMVGGGGAASLAKLVESRGGVVAPSDEAALHALVRTYVAPPRAKGSRGRS